MDSHQLRESNLTYLTLAQAEAAAIERLRLCVDDLESVVVEAIELEGIGWMFIYQSRALLETGNVSDALLGNSPIIVDLTGQIHEPMSGDPLDEYIAGLRERLRSSDPKGPRNQEEVEQ
jgi:hypothetical protein